MQRVSVILEQGKEVKSFEEVKKQSLARVYGDVVDTYYEVCSMLTSHSSLLMEMRTLRKQLKDLSTMPSLEQQTRARIENLIKDLEDSKESILYLKDAYDAKLRFYNSFQYMMTGERFKDLS